MDEERRTSANLAACIDAVKDRIVFINTGFLDRTGDEIHTSMRAGPMVRKARDEGRAPGSRPMRSATSPSASPAGFPARRRSARACGRRPTGWPTCWRRRSAIRRPAPTPPGCRPRPRRRCTRCIITQVDVFARQRELAGEPVAGARRSADHAARGAARNWSPEEIRAELDNNAQGILGYVVRWIDQGVGCSKVPDIHDVGLMEDRATLRISSQHIANWLLHGVCTRGGGRCRAARAWPRKVDAQNAGDPLYRPMARQRGRPASPSRPPAPWCSKGVAQPNGYTEPLLHAFRRRGEGREADAESVTSLSRNLPQTAIAGSNAPSRRTGGGPAR